MLCKELRGYPPSVFSPFLISNYEIDGRHLSYKPASPADWPKFCSKLPNLCMCNKQSFNSSVLENREKWTELAERGPAAWDLLTEDKDDDDDELFEDSRSHSVEEVA